MIHVLLDTDVGTNVDDAVAIDFLARESRVDLLGINCTGDAEAARALAPGVPVRANDPAFLVEHARGGGVTLLTIGPLTTVAAAIGSDPGFAPGLRRAVSMLGSFGSGRADTNAATDPAATAAVLAAPIAEHRIIGLDVTQRCVVRPEQIRTTGALAPMLRRWGADVALNDPLAAACVTDPSLCRWERGTATIDAHGTTTFTPGEGRHLVAVDVDVDRALATILHPDEQVGAPPHPEPWPGDERLDRDLLEHGDRRNVVDAYRYWRHEAIVADLDARRFPYHVAIENWRHDLNIGTVVRNANAFMASSVRIVGLRKWNRRGAMVTDRYQHIAHHDTIEDLLAWARAEALPVIGIDNLPGSRSILDAEIPRACVLLFGQEGPGLSDAAREACEQVLHIPQFGSTRSINAGVASGIAMMEWLRRYAVQ